MSDELTELAEIIETLRIKLNAISKDKSLTDPEVIGASQMLDVLLVQYQKILRDKNK
jgi:hypothetical protein